MHKVVALVCITLSARLLFACDDASALGADDAGTEAEAGRTCAGTGVTKGPWVLAVDDTHAVIRWETCRNGTLGTVAVTPEGGAAFVAGSTESETDLTIEHRAVLNFNATTDYAGAWFMHEAPLESLTQGTCYDYRLDADTTRVGRFCTAKPSGAPLRLLAIGDTNVGLGDSAANVLSHVIPMAPDFTMHLGDIEYYDSGFDTWQLWDQIMRPLLARGAFFPAIGNHESETPDEYTDYTERFFHGTGFAGNDEYYRFESGGVQFFVLDTQDSTDATSAQAGWFAQQIVQVEQEPGYRFSIVYFHKPFVTCGDTGDDPLARQFFEPLFLAHKVPLVLQAHMHGYERFDFGNITYVTTAGGGGAINNPNENIQRDYCGSRVASGAFYHATIIDIAAGIHGTVVDDQGTVRDTFDIAAP